MTNWILFLAQVFAGTGTSLMLQMLVAKLLGDEHNQCGELRACRTGQQEEGA
jgi:galactitol-specific phosphotransferase system IIB component